MWLVELQKIREQKIQSFIGRRNDEPDEQRAFGREEIVKGLVNTVVMQRSSPSEVSTLVRICRPIHREP